MNKKLIFSTYLNELKKRLCFAILCFVICSAVSFYFIETILHILKIPARSEIGTFAVFSPTEAITSFLKIAMVSGFILSIPVFLYEIWMFILPALKKRHAWNGLWFILLGTALFSAGVIFSFFFSFPPRLNSC